MSIRTGGAALGLRLSGYGYGDALHAVGTAVPHARANRVIYQHGPVSEWYANGPLGLEQGFSAGRPPAGRHAGPLTLALSVVGNLRGSLSDLGTSVTFTGAGAGATIAYRDLVVSDARGRLLRARIELAGGRMLLRVADAGALYPIKIDPFFQAKLTASDGAVFDALGASVAVSGDTIVAGAPGATVGGNSAQGALYVFTRPAAGWASATQAAKLTASDGAADQRLGFSVALSGDTIAAGAAGTTVSGHAAQGAAYVFVEPKRGWTDATQTAKLAASDGAAGDLLGLSVAVAHDTVVAGAPVATVGGNPGQGAAYVFVEPEGGWADATQSEKLTAADGAANDLFGFSVAVSHDTVVAGAFNATVSGHPGRGAAYVFVEPKGGWTDATQTAKLTASDGPPGGTLGFSVAVSPDTIVAGAPAATVTGNAFEGAAYVFVKPAGGWADATQTARLTASDGAADASLGGSVAVSGGTIVAGATGATVIGHLGQGAAYVFVEPAGGWADATQTAKLTAADGAAGDQLGMSVAVAPATVIAGAPDAAVNGNIGQGAAYLFQPRF